MTKSHEIHDAGVSMVYQAERESAETEHGDRQCQGWTQTAFRKYQHNTSLATGFGVGGGILAANMLEADEFPGVVPLLLPMCLIAISILVHRRATREFVASATPTPEQRELWKPNGIWSWLPIIMGISCVLALDFLFPLSWVWWGSAVLVFILVAFVLGRGYRARERALAASMVPDSSPSRVRFPTYLETDQAKNR